VFDPQDITEQQIIVSTLLFTLSSFFIRKDISLLLKHRIRTPLLPICLS